MDWILTWIESYIESWIEPYIESLNHGLNILIPDLIKHWLIESYLETLNPIEYNLGFKGSIDDWMIQSRIQTRSEDVM